MMTDNQNTVTNIKNSYLNYTVEILNFTTFALFLAFSIIQCFNVSLEINAIITLLLSIGTFLIISKIFTSNFEKDISGLLDGHTYLLVYRTNVDFLTMLNIVIACVVIAFAYMTKTFILQFDPLVESFPFSSVVTTSYFCAAFLIYYNIYQKLLTSVHCTLNDFIRG